MKKKAVIIIAILVALCLAGYLIVTKVLLGPIYEKEAVSYEDWRSSLEEDGIFAPTEDKLPFTVEKALYYTDGGTPVSPVIGYDVRGTMTYKDVPIHCELMITSYRRASDLPKETTWVQYPYVECRRSTASDLRMADVVFSYGEQNYELAAIYPKDTPEEVDDYLARKLTRSAAVMLMQAGVENGSYPILPKEMTDSWSIEQPNGMVRITAAAVPRGDTIYYLTEDEYQQVAAGADVGEVLGKRWQWYKEEADEPVEPIVPDPEPLKRPEGLVLSEEEYAAAFTFAIDSQTLSLGYLAGDYPWDYAGFPATAETYGYSDWGQELFNFTYGGVKVDYAMTEQDGKQTADVFRMTTTDSVAVTPGGIAVGDTVDALTAAYPYAVYCDTYWSDEPPYYDCGYIYEPKGTKHIIFFAKDGVITAIEMEDLKDGQLLH